MQPLEKVFTTARQLIEFVSPLNAQWASGRYIFRGQPSDQHSLIPSVCRRGAGSFACDSPRRIFGTSITAQVNFEIEVLKRFLDGCDRSGLAVPGYTSEIKKLLTENPGSFLSSNTPWPPSDLYQIMAVAQHYDVPTRLLDWTEKAFVACYFAAASANFKIDSMNPPPLAIWALDTTYADSWETVEVIRTPGGTSKNQAAQSGLFTTHKIKDCNQSGLYQADALEGVAEIYRSSNNPAQLIKMTLPIGEAPELLTLCSQFGVDSSTLFPGYYGVAKGVRDWIKIEIGVRPSSSLIDEYNQQMYDDD